MSIYKKNGKYYCRFQFDGERHHLLCTGATTSSEAKKLEAQFMYKFQQKANGVLPVKDMNIRVSHLISYYLTYAQNKKSYRADKCRAAVIKSFFLKQKYIRNIKSEDIEKFKHFLLKKNLSKTTVNRYLEILSKMFNMAIDNDWISKNLIKKGTKFPVKNYQVRFLTKEEEKKLFEVAPEHFKPILILALNSGLRKGNIRKLKWNNVLLEQRLLDITENKGNKHIKLYINDTLYNMFRNLPKKDDEYVFINPNSKRMYSDEALRDLWNSIKKKAGITNLRFHDLRHTVGTRLAEKNVPINVIKEIFAHTDIRTTMRYVHSASTAQQTALSLLDKNN